VKCDVTSANKEWGKNFQFQGNLPFTKKKKKKKKNKVSKQTDSVK
jgi:hypothetical protein